MITPEQVKDRVERVFRFLAEVARRRIPVPRHWSDHEWRQLLSELPDHPFIAREGQSADGDRVVLRVKRPMETACPPPPVGILEWVIPGWNDPSNDARHLVSRNIQVPIARDDRDPDPEEDDHPSFQGKTIEFGENLLRVGQYAQWIEQRERWREAELPTRRVLAVFQRLFELRGKLERESERLALWVGEGMLRIDSGRTANVDLDEHIEYPLFLQRCELHFFPEVPAFEIHETDDPPELTTSLLRQLAVDGRVLNKLRERLAASECGILDPPTTELLVETAHSLFANCEYAPSRPADNNLPCVVFRDPVVFIAARSGGMVNALDALIERIRGQNDIPVPVRDIVVAEDVADESEEAATSSREPRARQVDPISEDVEPLLTKPSNAEQEDVVRHLHRRNDVVVQGPPGTGKTHTIANLIGHLLAQGKSVLVTSHTTKALRVLRDHVVDELKPLCVSVLDHDQESRSQLEQSVKGIIAGLSRTREERVRLAEESGRLRRSIKSALDKVMSELHAAVRSEYEDIIVAGQGILPSEAARTVRHEAGSFAWLRGPLVPGVPLPLAEAELSELYATNAVVSPENEVDLVQHLPSIDELPTPQQFASAVEELRGSRQAALNDDAPAWRGGVSHDAACLQRLLEYAEDVVETVRAADRLTLECMDAGRLGGTRSEPWNDLVRTFEALGDSIDRANALVLKHGPTLSVPWTLETQRAVCEELLMHARAGRRLKGIRFSAITLVKHQWSAFVQGSQVSGRPPADEKDMQALAALLQVEHDRDTLRRRWKTQIEPLGRALPGNLGSRPEDTCRQLVARLRSDLAWHERAWKPLLEEMDKAGVNCEDLLSRRPIRPEACGELIRQVETIEMDLRPAVRARVAQLRVRDLEQWFTRVATELGPSGLSRLGDDLKKALRQRDTDAYRFCYADLQATIALKSTLRRRVNLIDRLKVAAPSWAEAIARRIPPHDQPYMPDNAERAWFVRQLQEELTRRDLLDPDRLQSEAAKLRTQLHKQTSRYVEHLAWGHQHDRVGRVEQAALKGWQATVNRRGFQSGIMSARLKAEARTLLGKARAAVPVWIMPLSRVVESYDFADTQFDVVIVDEASQCDMTGLVALGISKQAVVVGDDKQVSPVAVGEDLTQIQTLIDQYLQGVSNAHLYTGRQSLYDMATYGFGNTIRLTEHFRCVADIIAFSNHLSYDGEIKPLRDASGVDTRPFVVNHRTSGGVRTENAKSNEAEAEEIVGLVAAICECPQYRGKSIGVISLLGEEQALLIDSKLRERLSGIDLATRNLLCGIPAHFQGDERDIIFLSMVDSPRDGGPLRSNANNDDIKKRFNVAASRARDQLWVVHSLSPGVDLQEADFRRRLIEHAVDPAAIARQAIEMGRRAESEFERLVAGSLGASGYRLVPQWRVGALRIDMVVIGPCNRKVAIECDGDRYHPPELLERDLARQEVLERQQWRFVRIRGSAFFRDPEGTMARVRRRLSELDIEPIGATSNETKSDTDTTLLMQVLQRAAELRREWNIPADEDAEASGDNENDEEDNTDHRLRLEAAPSQAGRTERTQGSTPGIASDRGAEIPQDADRVLACLREAGRPLGRRDILDRSGIQLDRWTGVIHRLLEAGLVMREGDKRGTRYFIPGPKEGAQPRTPHARVDGDRWTPCARAIVAALRRRGRAMTKAELILEPGIERGEWSQAVSQLYRAGVLRRASETDEVAHELRSDQ